MKSRSLDESTIDLRRQLEAVEQEAQVLKDKVEDLDRQNDKLIKDNRRLQLMAGRKVRVKLNHYNQQLQLAESLGQTQLIQLAAPVDGRKENEANQSIRNSRYIHQTNRNITIKQDTANVSHHNLKYTNIANKNYKCYLTLLMTYRVVVLIEFWFCLHVHRLLSLFSLVLGSVNTNRRQRFAEYRAPEQTQEPGDGEQGAEGKNQNPGGSSERADEERSDNDSEIPG